MSALLFQLGQVGCSIADKRIELLGFRAECGVKAADAIERSKVQMRDLEAVIRQIKTAYCLLCLFQISTSHNHILALVDQGACLTQTNARGRAGYNGKWFAFDGHSGMPQLSDNLVCASEDFYIAE